VTRRRRRRKKTTHTGGGKKACLQKPGRKVYVNTWADAPASGFLAMATGPPAGRCVNGSGGGGKTVERWAVCCRRNHSPRTPFEGVAVQCNRRAAGRNRALTRRLAGSTRDPCGGKGGRARSVGRSPAGVASERAGGLYGDRHQAQAAKPNGPRDRKTFRNPSVDPQWRPDRGRLTKPEETKKAASRTGAGAGLGNLLVAAFEGLRPTLRRWRKMGPGDRSSPPKVQARPRRSPGGPEPAAPSSAVRKVPITGYQPGRRPSAVSVR